MSPTLRARLGAVIHERCPRCLKGRVFRPGPWYRLDMYYACPACRVVYGREDGYFTGAMIVSYVLAVPLLGLLALLTSLITGWSVEVVLLAACLYALPFAPPLFRYSRVIWMHFDRAVDSNLESERYAPPRRTVTQPPRPR